MRNYAAIMVLAGYISIPLYLFSIENKTCQLSFRIVIAKMKEEWFMVYTLV